MNNEIVDLKPQHKLEVDKTVLDENGIKIKRTRKQFIHQYGIITLGILVLNIAFYFFLDPARIVTGGIMGISIIIKPLLLKIGSWFTQSIFIFICNTILLFIGLIFLGKDFFLKTCYGSLVSPLILFVLERVFDGNYFYNTIPEYSQSIICLICGGLLAGAGIGLTVKYNGSSGGMDVIQMILSKYLKVPMSFTLYFTDAVIVLFAGFTFNPFQFYIANVVYGVIGVIMAGFIIDAIALSLRSRRTVYVITKNPELVKNLIYENLERGVTFCPVTGAYTGNDMTMVICTMNKNEAYRIVPVIAEKDPKAFSFVTSCKEVRGEYEKRGLI